ncbi:MAG: ACT domain-containing protein [Planctomycetota bacterium]
MKAGTQFSVMLQNKPGELAKLCRKLARAKVNIAAISVAETTEQGIVRLVVEGVSAARKVLKKAKVGFVTSRVLLVDLENEPGALADAAGALADKKVNVQFVYGTTGPRKGDVATVVIGVDEVEKAKKVLA